MKLHLISSATPSRRNLASCSNPVRLGTLALAVVFTATQMPAQPTPPVVPQPATQQVSDTSAGSIPTPATNTTAATVPSTSPEAVKSESALLPEAPMEKPGSQETASVSMPPNVRAMFNDAVQQSQNLQTTQKSKGVQRPGQLIVGIAGLPLIAFGTYVMTRHVSTNSGLKDGFGAAFLVPGALMSGLGFTFAFKPKNN